MAVTDHAGLSPLAARLEALRGAAGLSQAELSRRAGLAASAVNEIVTRPDRSPRLATVLALARVLGVSAAALISAEPEAEDAGLVPVQAPDSRWFRAMDCHGVPLGIRPGDLVETGEGGAVAGGLVVAIQPGRASGCAFYAAPPFFFGFDALLRPKHYIAPEVGRGRLLRVLRIVRGEAGAAEGLAAGG